jgi:type II secretory pathway predicted ATPase ExeA
MREDDWGPARLPFHAATGGPFLTPTFEEAAARLLFLAERHWAAGWLVGPSGCGKTALLKHVRRELRRNGTEAVLLSLCGVDGDDFWPLVASALGSQEVESGLPARKTVRALLVASAAIGRAVTLLFDDTDRGGVGLWDQVAVLVRMAEGVTPAHTIVVATGGELPPGDIARRVDIRAELRPFGNEDTAGYVEHRLKAVGCEATFAPEAVAELYAATAGVPSAVNRLGDLALVAADAAAAATVTVEFVRSATADLRPLDDEPLVTMTAGMRPARFSA